MQHVIGAPPDIAMLKDGELQHVESGEEEDVLEVVARLKERDAGLQSAEPDRVNGGEAAAMGHDEDSDEVQPPPKPAILPCTALPWPVWADPWPSDCGQKLHLTFV